MEGSGIENNATSHMDMGSSSSNDQTYIPQVRVQKIPKIGQEFDSLEDAHNFYNEYAREAGFSIRMWSTKKNPSNEIIRREFVCYKQGTREQVESTYVPTRKRGLTREGCNAKIVLVKSSISQSFIVSIFYEPHNHVLTTPRKVHLLRSHRSMCSAKKALTQQLSAANVPIHKQISILEIESGGIENIGCIEKDFYNARRDDVKIYAGHDAQMLYEYFESEKEKNSDFYFTVKMGDENKLTHCFWADMECRKAYLAFGDVVVFDKDNSGKRAESCHAFFKSYVSRKNTLMDFVVRFTRAIKRQRHQELYLDHKDINEQPITKTMFAIEKSMAAVYTQSIFYNVQEELYQSMAYMAMITRESENICLYNVVRVDGSQKNIRTIMDDKTQNFLTCSCKKFESTGYVCRHIFATFSRKMQVHGPLPDIYVLRRWTKSAKSFYTCSNGISDGRGAFDAKVIMNHNALRKIMSNIVESAIVNEEVYKIVFDTMESLQSNINAMSLNDRGQSSTPSIALSQRVYNEP